MSAATRRSILWISLPLLVVLAVWGIWSYLAPNPKRVDPTPLSTLTTIALPTKPNSLVWSVDGNYLAAGAWGRLATNDNAAGDVIIVDVAKASVLKTLEVKSWVEGLSFSPDGKWLAVGMRPSIPVGAAPAELIVFEVPTFTARFTAKSSRSENGFIDLSWSADSKSLFAVDGPVDNAQREADIRRWDVPVFTERPVVRTLQLNRPPALVVSPDSRTLALVESSSTYASQVRLYDLEKGTDKKTFKVNENFKPPRLGFTADSKMLGVFDETELTWWDIETGKTATPAMARFSIQPAGLSSNRSREALSFDCQWRARGHDRHRGFGDLGWDNKEKEFGSFITITNVATEKTRTWRVSSSQFEAPPVAFSPDGKKLAGIVVQPTGGAIEIWAMPE